MRTEREAHVKAIEAGTKPHEPGGKQEYGGCKKTVIDGNKAAVLVLFKHDGTESPLPVSLVKEDGSWRVTQVYVDTDLITKLMTPD